MDNITASANRQLFTIRGAAAAFGAPEHLIRVGVKRGKIKAVFSGNRAYLRAEAIEQFLNGSTIDGGRA